jgi:PqqD family protein of HPr-rel-A system
VLVVGEVVPLSDLHWRFLEREYVVYNSGSGHTHVLDPVAALLIQQLTEGWCDTAELVERIATLLNLNVDEDLRTRLEQTLSQLGELGLVELVIS